MSKAGSMKLPAFLTASMHSFNVPEWRSRCLTPAGEYNIRVNVIAPGIMEEGISKFLPSDLFDEYVKHCGLKRVGKVSEIATVITWFALHNTYVTGQSILVDGAL